MIRTVALALLASAAIDGAVVPERTLRIPIGRTCPRRPHLPGVEGVGLTPSVSSANLSWPRARLSHPTPPRPVRFVDTSHKIHSAVDPKTGTVTIKNFENAQYFGDIALGTPSQVKILPHATSFKLKRESLGRSHQALNLSAMDVGHHPSGFEGPTTRGCDW